ncbi:Transmembrane protein 201 homolog [Anthophora plagiata]
MELDLWFNFMPIFSIILLISVIIITVFQKLKVKWPVKVNCWFCNTNTKIWRQQLNWWMCPCCEQYNGFSKNGDYTYNIPEQYKIPSNEIKKYCTTNQDTTPSKIANNGLCKQCNMNESIKISKLSDYIPESEKNYEYEIKKFKDGLEKQYPLCAKCKTTVHSTLYKQALWLIQYKMLFFKQKSFSVITNNRKYCEPICRIISTVLGSIVAYNMEFILVPIGGLFFQFCACWTTHAKKQSSDILLMFLWICMIILLPFKDTKLIKTDLQSTWLSLEYVTQYHMIMLFVSIIGFINIMPKSHKSALNKNMSFKKMESFAKSTILSDSSTASLNSNNSFNVKTVDNLNDTITNQLSSNTMKEYLPLCVENSVNSSSTIFQNSFTNQESQASATSVNNNSAVFNSIPLHKRGAMDCYSLNDSLSTLSTLSLSEDKPKHTIKAPKIFEKKVYSTKSSELFKKSGKKHILSPPKLKSVTQTSWVAGGYWQEGIDAPSLSRSSSQSSGFGSMGSNFGPSREPSIHEFDQCSVMSDTTQSCYTLRQSNSPVGSFSQQSLQFSLSEPRNQAFSNQTMKITSPNLCTPQTLLLPQNHKRNDSVYMDQYSQGQNMNVNDIKNPSEMQMFPSHTTIVTSPVWLPTLLCGSLVLNIIVLCTTLLR